MRLRKQICRQIYDKIHYGDGRHIDIQFNDCNLFWPQTENYFCDSTAFDLLHVNIYPASDLQHPVQIQPPSARLL